MSALGDEEGDGAMSQIVKPHWLTDRIRHGGEPDPVAERVAANRSAFRCGEYQPVGAGRVVGEVLVDHVGKP